MLYCCPSCFKKDIFLKKQIAMLSRNRKKCDCCGSYNQSVMPIKEFVYNFIEPLVDLYVETDDCDIGKPLITLLKQDFCFLNELSDVTIKEILEQLTNSNIKKLFINQIDNELIKIWEEFKQEFKLKNRFFPNINIATDAFKELLGYLRLDKRQIPKNIYRARISHNGKIIPKRDMGSPPPEKSIAGRANPIGISYLYAASDKDTAIAELRPHKQHSITVATISVDNSIKLADLRSPKLSISPFRFIGENLSENVNNIHFLEHLSAELVRPILPKDSNLEYLPTQYLCELIKSCGFDGIIYKSSVGMGDNYAFFSSDKLTFKSVKMSQIESIKYDFVDL